MRPRRPDTSFGLRATLVAASFFVAACGGGGGSDDETPAPEPTSPVPAPTAAPPPQPTPEPAPEPTPEATVAPVADIMSLTEVASGLERPVYIVSPPDDPTLYVIEQPGRIRIIEDGTLLDEPFLDIEEGVGCCGERGLLGLAFHPSYSMNGRFFLNYTDLDGTTVIAEFARSADDPLAADPEPIRVFFTVEQPFANHNGGMVEFGPDGFLYIGLGDGGAGGDPLDAGQDVDTKLGKILRIDVDEYPTPPAGNFVGGDPDIWSYGLRNPWRFSFDAETGDLYIGDVGQNMLEEIDVEPAGVSGLNYGWRIMEGSLCFNPDPCDTEGLVLPAAEYGRDEGISVTGGYVYRGDAIPALQGHYIYGDFGTNRVWTFRWSDGVTSELTERTADIAPNGEIRGISSFGQDANHELYVVSYSDGRIFRIDPE